MLEFDPVSFEIGKLRAAFDEHIKAVERDREQAATDRAASATYRKEVREELKGLASGVAQIAPLKKRVDRMEPIVENSAKTLAGATLILSGGILLVGFLFKSYAADLKAFVWRVLRIS